jgi:hypothetical protein
MAELASIISANSKPMLASFEKEPSPPASPTQSRNPESAARITSVVPRTDSESEVAQPSETERLLDEILSSDPSNAESHLPVFENEISPAPFSDELAGAEAEIKSTAATSLVHTATQQTSSSLLAYRPASVPTDTNHSWPIHEQNSLPSLSSGQLRSLEPSGQPPDAAASEVDGGLPPQQASPLLAALRLLNAKSSPPRLEKRPSRLALAGQQDNAGMAGETIAHPSDAESMLAQPPSSVMPDMPAMVSESSASILEEARPVLDRAANEMPALKPTPLASSADTESAVTRAQQAKSLLDQLDPNTAIHLRWTMRDIRSKRTKFLPVSADDLTALVSLGLVEMRDGLPRLTTVGIIALD